jgi:hypothetical protein
MVPCQAYRDDRFPITTTPKITQKGEAQTKPPTLVTSSASSKVQREGRVSTAKEPNYRGRTETTTGTDLPGPTG